MISTTPALPGDRGSCPAERCAHVRGLCAALLASRSGDVDISLTIVTNDKTMPITVPLDAALRFRQNRCASARAGVFLIQI